MADRKRDQAVSGIGNSGHARVGDQRDTRALLHFLHQFGGLRHLVVLVIAGGAGRDGVVIEQLLRLARVFAGDDVDFLQNAQGAQRDVFEIADGRSDQI